MPDYIGLYYPHITFPSDAWVKLAAFYWDKLGRIVPPGYQHRDSDTVQRLQGELGFVEDSALCSRGINASKRCHSSSENYQADVLRSISYREE